MIEKFFRPYAKALLEASADDAEASRVRDELGRLAVAIDEVPLLRKMAGSPGIPMEVKEKSMAEIATSLELGPLAASFAQLLLKNYRLESLGGILGVVDEVRRRPRKFRKGPFRAGEPCRVMHRPVPMRGPYAVE